MKKGFTLLELLIVIIIIGILAIFALPQFFQTAKLAKITKARQVLGEIRSAQVIAKGLTGNYILTWPVTATMPGSNIEAVRLEDPSTADPYYTYSVATDGQAVATPDDNQSGLPTCTGYYGNGSITGTGCE
jgi:prepilin-type N-terminal cleavage/methylation domain-containing protein